MSCPVPIAAAITHRLLLRSELGDVYTCGVLLWEMLVGASFEETRDVLPGDVRDDCPAAIDDILDRATRDAEWQRFATPAEMADALAGAVHLATAEEIADWFARTLVTEQEAAPAR